jgi:DNA modification methylase
MEKEAFYDFLLSAFKGIESVMAKDASIYVFHADTEGLNFRKAFSDAGFYLSGTCIWKKQSLVLGRSPYQWQHEPVLFGWKKKGKHNWYSDRKQTTIWEFEKPKKNKDHPTMKPVALVAYPILNSSLTNCIVLDPFGGSGSTLIACEQTDRICHMIEFDEKYTDVIVKRYIEQVGSDQDVYLIRNGKKTKYANISKD